VEPVGNLGSGKYLRKTELEAAFVVLQGQVERCALLDVYGTEGNTA